MPSTLRAAGSRCPEWPRRVLRLCVCVCTRCAVRLTRVRACWYLQVTGVTFGEPVPVRGGSGGVILLCQGKIRRASAQGVLDPKYISLFPYCLYPPYPPGATGTRNAYP